MPCTMEDLCAVFEKGIRNTQDRTILGQSLFYYCCGKDPTPIIAFGSDYPLYVYADIVGFGSGDFNEETQALYGRLKDAGFRFCDVRGLKVKGEARAALTMWNTLQGKCFFLLYVQDYAIDAFRMIYDDDGNRGYYIKPKCFCNCYYEFFERRKYDDSAVFFDRVEKRTEYILGEIFDDRYRRVAEYDYYGDYGSRRKIGLYQRMFWYWP